MKFDLFESDDAADLALVSDVGCHHPVNQDAGKVGRNPTGAVIAVVADGVSSSDQAEVASASAVAAAYRVLVEAADDQPGRDVARRAITAAHAAVMAIPHAGSRLTVPQTTIVAALVRRLSATIAWVGDSRAYAICGSHSRLLTRDDSWLADAIDTGIMTPDEARTDHRSHSITQCLGMLDGEISVHVRDIILEHDSWLLVCSDGLWNYFDRPAALAQAVREAAPDADAFELCRHLVKLANRAGGHDNITVAAYHLGDAEYPGKVRP